MSVKLQKEHVKLSEVICSRYCQTTAECDVIVPDIKPDVLKVLRTSSEVAITEKTILTDRVTVSGTVRTNILYIPDGNVLGSVKSISTTSEFSCTIDVKGAKPGMKLFAEAECESSEHSLTNSRKLNIRNKISLSIKLISTYEAELTTGVEENNSILTRCEHLKICNSGYEAEREFVLQDRLDVPSGKPGLAEILKVSAKPTGSEIRLIDGKAIIKGELCLTTLYCGDEEENSIQCMEHSIPFTEILEVNDITEKMTAESDYIIKDISCEICRDPDGDKRILSTEITVCVVIRATEIIECDAILDAYGTDYEISTDTLHYNIEHLIDTTNANITLKEPVSVPDYLPEVYQIFDCSATANIEGVITEENKVTVNGYITCDILYMSEDNDTPISGFSHILPYTHTFDINGVCKDSICDVKADIEHLSYTIPGHRNIDLRAIVALSLKAVCPESCEFISDISINSEDLPLQFSAITVYFIKPGDTLWNIAKHFRTSVDTLLENNSVDPNNLQIGTPLYIFR